MSTRKLDLDRVRNIGATLKPSDFDALAEKSYVEQVEALSQEQETHEQCGNFAKAAVFEKVMYDAGVNWAFGGKDGRGVHVVDPSLPSLQDLFPR